MFEHRRQPLISRKAFARRVVKNLAVSLLVIAVALGIGVFGYRFTAGLPWIDSLLNASMILGGMGPVDTLRSDAAKLFASFYALFSGLVFIGVAAMMLAPVAHRFLHRFHLEIAEENEPPAVSAKRK